MATEKQIIYEVFAYSQEEAFKKFVDYNEDALRLRLDNKIRLVEVYREISDCFNSIDGFNSYDRRKTNTSTIYRFELVD